MEADECIRDVIRSTETEYQSRRCVLPRLESVDKVGREADQCAIAAKLKQCCEAARHRPTHVSAHHQVGVDKDARVAHGGHRCEPTVSVAVGSRWWRTTGAKSSPD